jgi:hypothetical protein
MRLTTSGSFALAFALAAVAGTTHAQQLPKQNLISIQPIGVVLAVYAAEYERAVSPTTTIGIGGTSWAGLDDEDFEAWSAEAKFRYYPEAKPFQGFSFGVSAGVARVEEARCDFFTGGEVCTTDATTAPSFGFLLDYNWLLGPTDGFYVGLGIGAKRVLTDDDDEAFDFPNAYPTARLSVGIAF